MSALETRLACPVCLGVQLHKTAPAPGGGLVLDHCTRCGGVWFERGEVQQLRQADPQWLWREIAPRTGVHRMQCHDCHAPLERGQERCGACGWAVRLDCPHCLRPMEAGSHGEVHLDYCTGCSGVWFDHHELMTVWSAGFTAALRRRESEPGALGAAPLVLADVLAHDPFALYLGARLAAHAGGAAIEGLSHVPELATGAVEAAGEAAATVFETIVEIIAGLFS